LMSFQTTMNSLSWFFNAARDQRQQQGAKSGVFVVRSLWRVFVFAMMRVFRNDTSQQSITSF